MRVTFIIKNITESMHAELAAMPDADRFAKLSKWAFGDLKHLVSQKIGSGQFRDRVELNSMMKSVAGAVYSYTLESRKGYKLATFEITKA